LFLRVPILPSVLALTPAPSADGIGWDVLHRVGTLLIGSVLRGLKLSGFVFIRVSDPRLVSRYYDLC
jgi:hypothetical protein